MLPAQALGACPGEDRIPSPDTGDEAAQTLTCVLNEIRASRGLARLHSQDQLERQGRRHARDMVRRSYFSHTTPEGVTFDERLRSYRTSPTWAVGETLAWGRGPRSAPAAVAEAWLDSPPHRRVLLNPRYRDVGIGVAGGVPVSDRAGATYAAEFGARR